MGFFTFKNAHSSEETGGHRPQPANDGGPKIRRRFRFVGEVQAVGFRWNTANLARAAGATGWVRNELDGSVTAEIQGTQGQVASVLAGLDHHFNGSSRFGGFRIAEQENLTPCNGERSFDVRYS